MIFKKLMPRVSLLCVGLFFAALSNVASAYTIYDLQAADQAHSEATYEVMQLESQSSDFYQAELDAWQVYSNGIKLCVGNGSHPLECEDGWWNEYEATMKGIQEEASAHATLLDNARLVQHVAMLTYTEIYTALYG